MSKLIDRLKQMTEGVPQPLGFGRAKQTLSKPRLQLVASLTSDVDSKLIAQADAAFVSGGIEAEAIKGLASKSSMIWGIEVVAESDLKALEQAGADFAVLGVETSVSVLADSKMGKFIRLDPALTDGLIRAANSLPIDAVVMDIKPVSVPLTFASLMAAQRIAGQINKPCLLPVTTGIDKASLGALWEAGIDGVIITVNSTTDLKPVREIIDSLDHPAPKKRARLAIAPHFTVGHEHAEDGDGEEDE